MKLLPSLLVRDWSWAALTVFALLGTAGLAVADQSDELFTNATIRHLKIEIAGPEMDILREPVSRNRNGGPRPAVPGTVREGDLVWTNVAIHLKGSLGSFRPVDEKPALTLNFDKLAEKQRFHGLQKISLNNSVQDPTFVSERICRELYRAAGVPVPRVDWATVELNGNKLGLYVLAEGWNKQFLRRYFTDAKGNFYDPGGRHDVNQSLKADFGENLDDHSALRALAAAAAEPDPARRLERLRGAVDLDRLLSLHALDILLWNWDGYGMNRNNYRLFQDRNTGRIVFLPHGLDQMFGKADGPVLTGGSGLVVRSVLETTEGRRLYLDRLAQIRSSIVDLRAVTNRVAELAARLQPALKRQGLFAFAFQQQAAQQWREKIVARLRDVDAQLAALQNFVPLDLNASLSLTNWTTGRELGEVRFAQTAETPRTLRLTATDGPALGAWITTVWLEEGRYRIEGRVKTLGVQTEDEAEGGAGFRVWSTRKQTRGANWDWFPYNRQRDSRRGGVIPASTLTPQQRLRGDAPWTLVTHEFELRQPLADLQIQCLLQGSAGAAWFDLDSLKIRRVALQAPRNVTRGD